MSTLDFRTHAAHTPATDRSFPSADLALVGWIAHPLQRLVDLVTLGSTLEDLEVRITRAELDADLFHGRD